MFYLPGMPVVAHAKRELVNARSFLNMGLTWRSCVFTNLIVEGNDMAKVEAGRSDRESRYWYAVYTRPRFEKKVYSDYRTKQIRSLLPLHQVSRVWSDRIKILEEPLFPSYVFVHANARERYAALQSAGVVRMVSFSGNPVRIPDEQIEAIDRIVRNGYEVERYQYLKYGDPVEIVSGPLAGLRGFFIEERGSGRLAVSVHEIQQTLVIQIERGKVRKSRQKASAGMARHAARDRTRRPTSGRSLHDIQPQRALR